MINNCKSVSPCQITSTDLVTYAGKEYLRLVDHYLGKELFLDLPTETFTVTKCMAGLTTVEFLSLGVGQSKGESPLNCTIKRPVAPYSGRASVQSRQTSVRPA